MKVPRVPQVQFSDQLMAGKPTLIEPENRPTDGQKTDLMMVGKPSPNQTTINNLTENQTMGASGGAARSFWQIPEYFSVTDRIRRVAGRVPRQAGTVHRGIEPVYRRHRERLPQTMPPLSVCGQTGTEREPQNRASPITHSRRERAYEHHIFRND